MPDTKSGIFNVRWGRLHRVQRSGPPDRHWDQLFHAYVFSFQKDYMAVYAVTYKKCAGFS